MSKNLVHIYTTEGEKVLYLYPPHNNPAAYKYVEDAAESGEAACQLFEGTEYEYRFEDDHLCFVNDNPLLKPSLDESHRGRIITGNHVGSLHLKVIDGREGIIGCIDFEVRSKKIDYKGDYQKMMADITAYYTELVMLSSSPVTQRFMPDAHESSRTLYQKFAFVKSIIESEEFDDALHKILYNPMRNWAETTIDKPISATRRIGRSAMRQIASSGNRMRLPKDMLIDGRLNTVPRTLQVVSKKDTIDTAENRFVKYVLTTFHDFCRSIQDLQHAAENEKLMSEAKACCRRLENILSNNFFREIHYPQFIALNSPVLQKREGYREVLQAWTIFDLAAKLTWKGGDNVYSAGKRNVAALYEYWLFFKLLELVSEKFELSPKDKASLVHLDKDGIDLNLNQGRMIMVGGTYKSPSRNLHIRFFYNRTFGHNSAHDKRGSWTTTMRPDYTLSIWTGDITEAEAEEQNTIVHIHFDAKYRVDNILLLDEYDYQGSDRDEYDEALAESLNEEKRQEQVGVYKRADLLKMHAYNDAIRRTGGSYVLYPGTKEKSLRGFHEIIPGLGAFPVNPNTFEEDAVAIKQFIDDLILHFLNRISQRETKAYYDYEIHQMPPASVVCEPMPEPYGERRHLIPNNTNVLIGYCKNQEHMMWVLLNKCYNTRMGTIAGSLRLTEEITTAQYLLLHNESDKMQLMLRLDGKGARVMSREDLQRRAPKGGYTLTKPYYIVFDLLESEVEPEFKDAAWDLAKMRSDGLLGGYRMSGAPVGVSLATLMNYIKK